MSAHTVVVNDCAAVAVIGGPTNVRTRVTPQGERNFLLNFANTTNGLPRTLNSVEQDWIELAGSLFAIDLACARGQGDVAWQREIDAYIPVRSPQYWSTKAVAIEEIFCDFTADRLNINFVQDENPGSPPRQREDAFPEHDCVSLLSGGVDSYVGTARLISDGRRPLAISHTAAGAISHAQAGVEASLKRRLDDLERLGLTARKNGSSFPTPEPSQRSRSFLFLASATLTAAVSGVDEVFINENGVMAIHLPMTAARAGSLSTHTASPSIIERFQEIASDVLEAPIAIRNNLLRLTKPEVVELGLELELGESLASTVSCWAIGRTNRHCGTCAPCIMRRISFERHSVPDVVYADDAFEDLTVLDREFSCDNLTHLVRLVDDLTSFSDLQLQLGYPEILNGGNQISLTDTIALHRRWAVEAGDVLYAHSVPASLQ